MTFLAPERFPQHAEHFQKVPELHKALSNGQGKAYTNQPEDEEIIPQKVTDKLEHAICRPLVRSVNR